MDARKIVVIVEDVDVARTALQWAIENILRYGDVITLLHVYPPSANTNKTKKKKVRRRRLRGFQLALSFKDICSRCSPDSKTEIVVTEGDEEGKRIAALVREIRASTLVLGLHDQSFIYKLAMASNNVANNLDCKILAIKQQSTALATRRTISSPNNLTTTTNDLHISQIEIATLSVPENIVPPKIPYQICPDPSAILWRSRRRSYSAS